MSWGSSGGGGVSTAPGTPEAARGADALRPRDSGPPDDDRPPRPGCLRTVITTIAVLAALLVVIYAAGVLLGPAS